MRPTVFPTRRDRLCNQSLSTPDIQEPLGGGQWRLSWRDSVAFARVTGTSIPPLHRRCTSNPIAGALLTGLTKHRPAQGGSSVLLCLLPRLEQSEAYKRFAECELKAVGEEGQCTIASVRTSASSTVQVDRVAILIGSTPDLQFLDPELQAIIGDGVQAIADPIRCGHAVGRRRGDGGVVGRPLSASNTRPASERAIAFVCSPQDAGTGNCHRAVLRQRESRRLWSQPNPPFWCSRAHCNRLIDVL